MTNILRSIAKIMYTDLVEVFALFQSINEHHIQLLIVFAFLCEQTGHVHINVSAMGNVKKILLFILFK